MALGTKHKMSIDVVIVNWNAGLQITEAVVSIAKHHHNVVSSVTIVDNASIDDSLSRVKAIKNLPFTLQIIYNRENYGFGAACNQGAYGGRADYLLFLNPDTRLFNNSLSLPLDFLEDERNRSVGICGIQLIDERGGVSRSCAKSPTARMFYSKILGLDRLFPGFFQSHFMEEWDHRENREVDHVIGAFFFLRRRLFVQLNGFDERFFVYLEDLDFSVRAKQNGWTSYYLANAQAYHKGGGTSDQIKARRLFYSLQSRILYGYKHFRLPEAMLLMVGTLCIEPFIRLAFNLLRGSPKSVGETINGYLMLYGALPKIMAVAFKR